MSDTTTAGVTDGLEWGAFTEEGAVRFERVFAADPERLWEYLTSSEARGAWLASGPMEPRVGGAVELRFRHDELSPERVPVPERYAAMKDGHTLRGEVTRWDPPRALAFTWQGSETVSEVTFELFPEGRQVRLVLIHRRLASDAGRLSVTRGWHAHLSVLGDRIAGSTPGPFWTTLETVNEAYDRRASAG